MVWVNIILCVRFDRALILECAAFLADRGGGEVVERWWRGGEGVVVLLHGGLDVGVAFVDG